MAGNHTPTLSIRTVLLAGGFGTRVASLLPSLPKPMAPVAGRPFLEWVVRHFATYGLKDFILSTGHLAQVVAQHFAEQPVAGVRIVCRQETAPLGTAGGFLHAIGSSLDPVGGWLVANGDSVVVTDPLVLVRHAQASGWDAALLGLRMTDAARFGSLVVTPNGTLLEFAEKRPGPALINAGVYWFAPGIRARFPQRQPCSFETDVFPALLASEYRVGVVPVEASFIDIGTPDSLANAELFVRQNFLHVLSSAT